MAKSKAKVASKEDRTVSGEIMENVMKYSPREPFRLDPSLLNKTYTTIDVEHFDVGKNKSFSVLMEDEEGNVISISASALKRSRLITKDSVKAGKMYKDNENILLRSDANSIWNGSSYLHKGHGMKKSEEFIVPASFTLKYALLSEDQDGNPLLNPFLYQHFRSVVNEYTKRNNDEYPSQNDFKEELTKTEADNRFKFLPKSMTVPTPYGWVKKEVADFRHTLVFAK